VKPGDTALIQEVWREHVWAARPMRVVEDSDELVVLWFPRGTRWQAPTAPAGRAREPTRGERQATSLVLGEWTFRELEWDVDTLQLWRPGDWHSTWVSWLPDGTHWGWYVNIQLPFERTPRGLRTMDLVLDVIVDADGGRRLKDEDELATHVARGSVDRELEARIRAEAERILARRFDDAWLDWRPDPAWTRPELPRAWDRLVE